jgi:hypothetical protein
MKCHYCDNPAIQILVWLKDKHGQKAVIRLPWCGCDLMTALKKIWKTPYQVQKGVDYEIDDVGPEVMAFLSHEKALDHGGLDAQQLFEFLQKFTPEQRAEAKVFIRVAPEGIAFNIKTCDEIVPETYGFFGKSIPCLILHTEQFAPPEQEDEEDDEETEG